MVQVEGWSTPDEQKTAHLTHTLASDEDPQYFIVDMESMDGDTQVNEIVGAFETREEAAKFLTGLGYRYVAPSSVYPFPRKSN